MMKKFTLQELAVDKEYEKEQLINNANHSQNLYELAKSLINKDENETELIEEQNSSSDDSNIGSSSNTANTTNNYNDDSMSYLYNDTQIASGTSNMLNASGGEEDLNSGQEHIRESLEIFLAIEEEFIDAKIGQEGVGDTLKNIAFATSDKLKEATIYLKDIGIQYGPILAKNIGKAALYALSMTAKGLYLSTKSIKKQITQSVYSYNRLNNKIINIEKSIDLLNKASLKIKKPSGSYAKKDLIFKLSTGASFDAKKSLKIYEDFLKNYIVYYPLAIQNDIQAIRFISSSISTNRVSDPKILFFNDELTKGLKSGIIEGYKTDNENLSSYYYPNTLPGFLYFMSYLPNKEIKDFSDLYQGVHQSSYFYGMALKNIKAAVSADYLSFDETKQLFKMLKDTIKISEHIGYSLKESLSLKNQIGLQLKALLNKFSSKVFKLDKNQIQLFEYLSLKIYFMQKIHIRSLLETDTENRKILFNFARYIEDQLYALIEQNQKNQKS